MRLIEFCKIYNISLEIVLNKLKDNKYLKVNRNSKLSHNEVIFLKKILKENELLHFSPFSIKNSIEKSIQECKNWKICLIGDYPFDSQDILSQFNSIDLKISKNINNCDTWIIGRRNFIEELKRGVNNQNLIRIVPQEFFYIYLKSNSINYKDIYENIICHQAIKHLKSIQRNNKLKFKWPEIYFPEKINETPTNNPMVLDKNSLIMKKYGYSVKKGITKQDRRNALTNCINDSNIGLEYLVTKHIYAMIKTRHRMDLKRKMKGKSTLYDQAIDNWLDDLNWIKLKFYDKKIKRFQWPKIHI